MVLTGMVAAALIPSSASAAVISQGAFRMGADALWSRGILGQGQTVAIVDRGFQGLDRSIALGELPSREDMTIRVLDPAAGLDGRTELGTPTGHGVRMAELVHDMAPDARLVLVSYSTMQQFEQAAAWVASQGIPIVSHSNSFLTPPFDGTGAAARAVDAAAAAGVLWVNSAGNFAQRHWRGMAVPGGTIIPIAPPAGSPLLFSLAWSAPLVSASLAVERQDPSGAWIEVQRSAPAGPGNQTTSMLMADAGSWRVVVRQDAGPPAELTLFSHTVGFGAQAVAGGSIPTPGDAAGALSVGAVNWTRATLELYSSQGPTADGRAKPDLVGPTYVTPNPEWPGTGGTSAAAAHVAGAAALLRQARHAAGLPVAPADLRAALTSTAQDLGSPGPDLLYGAGMARLDTTPPIIRVRVTPGPRPLIRVRALDDGTIGLVRVTLNGRALRSARRPAVRLRLPALRRGINRVSITAEDMAGNVGARGLTLRGSAR